MISKMYLVIFYNSLYEKVCVTFDLNVPSVALWK